MINEFEASKLQIQNSTYYLSYEVKSPSLDFGNENFPGSGPAIITSGCSGISKITDEDVENALKGTNYTQVIVIIDKNENDFSCLQLTHALKCRKRSWCGGVMTQEDFFSPAGRGVWSMFDFIRTRDDYSLLVEVTIGDIKSFIDLIKFSKSNNLSNTVTLTSSPNPWKDVGESIPNLILFRILTPIWSVCSAILVICILRGNLRVQTTEITSGPVTTSSKQLKITTTSTVEFRLTFKSICLLFQLLSHLSRIVYFTVDPFWTRQTYPYLVSLLILCCCVSFEIGATVFLSFLLHELTRTNKFVNLNKKIKYAFCFVFFFIALDFATSALTGLHIGISTTSSFIVKVLFYVSLNIGLGCWYFWQGAKFLRKWGYQQNKFKIENRGKKALVQASLLNSIAMILFGIVVSFISIQSISSHPWNYWSIYAGLTFLLQLTSVLEILLFGGVLVSFDKIRRMFGKKEVNITPFRQSDNGNETQLSGK